MRTRACCRSIGSSCAATSGCRAARCSRCSTACAGENILTDRSRRAGGAGCSTSPWVARRGAAARAAVDGRGGRLGAAADRHRPDRRRAVPRRRHGTRHRRVRPAVRRPRSADHRRPGGAGARRTRAGDEARAELAARVIAALGPRPELARRVSQIDVSDRARRRRDPERRPGACCTSARTGSCARLQSYLELATALRERVPDIDYVDLRFDDRIYVRPAAATTRVARGSRRRRAARQRNRQQCGGRVARKERYLVGLDVGTSKVTAVVGEMLDDGGLDIVGHRRGRVARHPARRRRQPRGGGRVDQEGDRGSRADGRRRDRLRAPRAVGPAHQGLQQPRRDRGRRQEPRDHARGRAARDRRGQGGVAADRARDPARAAAGLRRRRAGRHRRAGRDDRRAARGERPHRHRQPELDAEHRRVREPRRRRASPKPSSSSWRRASRC